MFGNETYYTELALKQKSSELLPLGARVTSVQLILVANRDLQDSDYFIIIMHQLEQQTIINLIITCYKVIYNILFKSKVI